MPIICFDCSFFACLYALQGAKNEPKKDTRGPRRVNNTAGPSDYFALLENAGILKTRGVYAPKGCSNSSKSSIGIFSGAQQEPMGNANLPLIRAARTRPFGLGNLLIDALML